VLDFLGFPRPNLDFSTGYAEQIAKDFSLRFFPGGSRAGKGFCSRGTPDRRIVHEGEPILISDFLQSFVVPTGFGCLSSGYAL
jgi:hypothetical protein